MPIVTSAPRGVSQAAVAWKKLCDQGGLNNPDVFPAWRWPAWMPAWVPTFVLPERTFPDRSILRWSDSLERWAFYDTKEELSWAMKLGQA